LVEEKKIEIDRREEERG